MQVTKPDVILHDGREVIIDLYQITIAEYRSLFDPKQPDIEGDAILAKCCGMTVEEVANLPQPDYRALSKIFFQKAREPLADPN